MAMTITYKVKNGIYVNMTNRCPCAIRVISVTKRTV